MRDIKKENTINNNDNKNYFLVTAKCGHVGKSYYIPITFPIIAKDAKTAAKIVRGYSRVKHDHKDAILNIEKVDLLSFTTQSLINNKLIYLHCSSKKDQKLINDWIEKNRVEETETTYKQRMGKKFYITKDNNYVNKFGKKIRNLKKYSKYNMIDTCAIQL